MKNTDVHWERIRHSVWAGVYLSEIYWLARDTAHHCEAIFEDVKAPPNAADSYFLVDRELHMRIYQILNNAARIAAFLKQRGKRNQSAGQYAIQQERVKWLRSVFDGVETTEISHARVRNSLEHFDEYIDETALKSSRGDIPKPTFFPMDMAFGQAGTMDRFAAGRLSNAHSYPLRVYLADERTFVNCGQKVSLDAIARESSAIVARLHAMSPMRFRPLADTSAEAGATILVVSKDHYDRERADY
ncbi:hypothetical protein [Paenarthrobacter sp. Y-19]|uniref:hypothetical protein n=1 Tax=Paenarthrobacter sp. Y-19 TaxID=3031125 RepID=UPI0023D98538|nr:hypothetical protein [Paenarthrobacter sp. Y-19]